MIALLPIAIVWWIVGVASFLFWWSVEHEVLWPHIIFAMIFGGAAGPLAWPMGWLIHGGTRR